jgi:hypothetical protein
MIGFVLDLIVASVLWSAVAFLVESALRLYRRPTRWVWGLAMVLSIALPVLTRLLPAWEGTLTVVPLSVLAEMEGIAAGATTAFAGNFGWDTSVGLAWALTSIICLGIGLWSMRRLSRRRAAWWTTTTTGVRVWRSHRFGPAVVGVRPSGIVLPDWVFALGARDRRLILVHEGEHARAGDVPLVVGAAALLVLMPWNPLLWWQLGRLRAAVEIDCDRRVLESGIPAPAYASLLLDIPMAHRFPPSPVLAFAMPRSLLGRRIDLMTRRGLPPWIRRARAVATVGAALVLTLVACDAAAPTTPLGIESQIDAPEDQPFEDQLPLKSRAKAKAGFPAQQQVKLIGRAEEGVHEVRVHLKPVPLTFVDGVEVSEVELRSLDKGNIASVTVLKGAAAEAQFGERGRAGVIRIKKKN